MELDLPPEAYLPMPRVPVSLCAGVVVYFLAMTGLSLFALKLSSVVTAEAIVLGLPYLLDENPPRPSRGEQRHIAVAQATPPMPVAKLTALTALLAQAEHQAGLRGEWPVVALDDLASELDRGHQALVLQRLTSYGAQVVITGTEPPPGLPEGLPVTMFHVEHGRIGPEAELPRDA